MRRGVSRGARWRSESAPRASAKRFPHLPASPETRYAAFGMTGNRLLPALVLVAVQGALAQSDSGSWKGILRDAAGKAAAPAGVGVPGAGEALRCRTDGNGAFELRDMVAGRYSLVVEWQGANWVGSAPIEIRAGARRSESLRLTADGQVRTEAGARRSESLRLTADGQ